MKLRLNKTLERVTLAFNTAAAPAGEAAAAPAGNEGGGGGGGGGDSTATVLDWQPPAVPSEFSPSGKGSDDPKPAIEAPPGAKKEVAKVDPPPGGEKQPKGEPAAQLRQKLEATATELATAKAELAKAREQFEAGDPRLKQYEADVAAARKELETERARSSEYEKKLAMFDPRVVAELKNLDDGYDAKAEKFLVSVPELDQQGLIGFAREYAALPFGKEGYREARAAFEAKVNKALGGPDDGEHRRLGKAIDFIEQTFDFLSQRKDLEGKIQKNSLDLKAKADLDEYTKGTGFLSESIKAAKTLPEGWDKTHGDHPKTIIHAFLGQLKPEEAEQFKAGIEDFIGLALGGPKPFAPEDFTGLAAPQIEELRAGASQNHATARKGAADIIYNGTLALRALPSMWKEIGRLRAALEKAGESAPPDPTGDGAGGGGGNGGDKSDVRGYVPPPVNFQG